MITRLNAGGLFPSGGIPSRQEHIRASVQSAGTGNHAYDSVRFSAPLGGDEARVQDLTAQLASQLRVRPSRAELNSLQQQIAEGRYQPDACEIAARMLLMTGEE